MELLEEAFHRMEDNFHTEDLVAAATLVAVVEVTQVEGQADTDSLVARLVAHREVRPDRQTTPQTPTVSGVAPTTAMEMGSLRTHGPGIIRVFTNFEWRKTSRSGHGPSRGSTGTGLPV